MTKKLTIPRACMPVVLVLRRDVKRPRLRLQEGTPTPRFTDGTCPMGAHKKSVHRTPICQEQFAGGVCSSRHVVAFFRWWDRLTIDQAREAVDLIWPREMKP